MFTDQDIEDMNISSNDISIAVFDSVVACFYATVQALSKVIFK